MSENLEYTGDSVVSDLLHITLGDNREITGILSLCGNGKSNILLTYNAQRW